jgi:hypothetical protein
MNHNSSMSKDHNQCELSRLPESCSRSICWTKVGEDDAASGKGEALVRWSQRNARKVPRNHADSGTPKPILLRLNSGGGSRSPSARSRIYFPLAVLDLPAVRDSSRKLSELMIEQRAAHFQRVGHGHAVDFHQHVTR